MMYLLPLVLAKKEARMCAYLNTSMSTSGCDVNDKAKCRKVPCDKKGYGCVSVYKNISGILKPKHMDCLPTERIYSSCGFDSCVLEYHNEYYKCCCSQNMCNINVTFPVISSSTTIKPTTIQADTIQTSNDIMLLVYILAPLFSLLFFCMLLAHLLRKHKDSIRQENDHLLETRDAHSPTNLSSSIQILETIHEGQFAKVFKAKYSHEDVAVKDIQPLQHELWTNEKDIYETCNLHHDNILRFIGAETRQVDDVIQYWIVTEYCSNGSLGDYLRKCTLSMSDLLQMSLCILKGLDFLHSNTSSVTIAHRDLKSSNILVKSDRTCCIADFGLSIAFPLALEGSRKSVGMTQVGTRRYMAPEVLRGAMTFTPECFLAVDMYSFALVAWELVSRTTTSPIKPDPYELPYGKQVGNRPTLDNMIQCVVEENKRPVLLDKWQEDSVLNVFCETIEECWDSDAGARVSASLAYLRLMRLSAQNSSPDEIVSNPNC